MLNEEFASGRSLVLEFYRCFDDQRMDRSMELLAPSFVAHLAGLPEPLDRQGFGDFGLSFYSAFEQGRHQFDEVLVAGDKIVTCGTFRAIHVASFQGLPPTGQQISLAVMHIDRVVDGQIVEHWGQGDALGLMQQLGIMFLPGPKVLGAIVKNTVAKIYRGSGRK
jgi:predicted ester cyclase